VFESWRHYSKSRDYFYNDFWPSAILFTIGSLRLIALVDCQVFLFLTVVQPKVLTPRLRRKDAVAERDLIDLRLLQLITDVQRRRDGL
jgi:hypothetical protein